MRIVVVEDSQIIRLDCRQILELAGFEVVGEGSDGIEAVHLCRSLSPHVILMDIKMPKLNGIEAARRILAEQPSQAIVFLTAYFEDKLIQEAMNLGAFGYLVKPLDEKTLVSTIQVAYAKSIESQDLEAKVALLSQKLDDRKIIERAKGVLMKRYQIDEESAYSMLRTLSMTKRCSISRLASLLLAQKDTEEGSC